MKLQDSPGGQAGKAKKTKTGQYATGEEVLVKLADEHEIAKRFWTSGSMKNCDQLTSMRYQKW
jgi:hypothetical protein